MVLPIAYCRRVCILCALGCGLCVQLYVLGAAQDQERPAPHLCTLLSSLAYRPPRIATQTVAAHARQPIGFAAAARLDPIIPLAAFGGAQLLAPPLPRSGPRKTRTGITSPPPLFYLTALPPCGGKGLDNTT
jgi:hypothetical protein